MRLGQKAGRRSRQRESGRRGPRKTIAIFWDVTYGSMLTGVTSLMADRTGGVMSQLSGGHTRSRSDWGHQDAMLQSDGRLSGDAKRPILDE